MTVLVPILGLLLATVLSILLVTFPTLAILLASTFVFHLVKSAASLRKNRLRATRSRLPHRIVPYYNYNLLTRFVINQTALPLLKRLFPASSPTACEWQNLVVGDWPQKLRHALFKNIGSDTFLTVAAGGIILNTSDAKVIAEILNRSDDFPKPVTIYRAMQIYGDNVVSAEGKQWKYHRKLVRMAFSEKNNTLVWQTSKHCSQKLLTDSSSTLLHISDRATNISLEVIGTAALGEPLTWDGSENERPREGYTMSFTAALHDANVLCIMYMTRAPWFLVGFLQCLCSKAR